MRPVQKSIYQTWLKSKKNDNRFVCVASRRLGKSTVGFDICVEEALKHPNSNILFITPVSKNVDRYVMDIAIKVLRDCPLSLKPEWMPQKSIYVFHHNGSKIFCVGSSNQSYENLRGTRVNLAVIDESQRMEDLEIIVDEVVMPSLMDSNGFLLMFGTVPRQPNHTFVRRYIKDAKKNGAYSLYDIYTAGYSAEQLARFRKQVSKEAWEREFECKFNSDKRFNVTPNFLQRHVEIIQKKDYYPMLVSYTAMDIGGALDQTHVIFAYYDSVIKKLVVTDEAVWAAQESRVDRIAKTVKEKEKAMTKKILRVSDTNNFILVKELQEKHRVSFSPVKKTAGSLEAQLEILNIWIEADRIRVAPNCKVLINELKDGSWNRSRTDLDRREGSHCDGLVALAYLLTIVNERASVHITEETEEKLFTPPPKDPLNLKKKPAARIAEKTNDESFEFSDVTSSIWKKDLD